MKQKSVGTYSDGVSNYQLSISEGDDSCAWNDGHIRIGVDGLRKDEIYDSLLHEILELIFVYRNTQYRPTVHQVQYGGKILFVFDHAEYSEICARVAKFMIVAWPDLLKAWKKWHKKSM